MGGLIKAEFRKVLTTKVWWALLIPTLALALGWAWVWSALGSRFSDAVSNDPNFRQLGVSLDNLPLSVFGLARAINITTIFPMLLGGLALSNEIRHKTITTTYLTAATRVSVLSSKLFVYVAFGALYGVASSALASVGLLLGTGSHTSLLPDAGAWLGIAAAGVLSSVLWTLLAVGVGALLGNVVGTLITLLLYSILVENVITLFLPGHVPGFLPNQAADGITSSLAAQVFVSKLPPISPTYKNDIVTVIQTVAGARGVFDWWLSAVIFALYVLIFFGGGWLASQQRDVT